MPAVGNGSLVMVESRKKRTAAEEVIAAFDRERAEAHEHRRLLAERIRASREHDRPVQDDKRHKA
ncbi:MAG: hypothetical protein AB7L71_00535 [Vicinamibacterales bacterium]